MELDAAPAGAAAASVLTPEVLQAIAAAGLALVAAASGPVAAAAPTAAVVAAEQHDEGM